MSRNLFLRIAGTLVLSSVFFAAPKKNVVDSVKEKTAVWFMVQTEKADVKSVVATSELVEAQFDGKYLYPPINILDGDFNSTWCEADKNGSGNHRLLCIASVDYVETTTEKIMKIEKNTLYLNGVPYTVLTGQQV